MKPDDRVRLLHIADALGRALNFVKTRHRDDLDSDPMLGYALMYALQIVGEAASKLSQEIRDHHAEIEWNDIIGMRHRLVHAYVDIDPQVVWQTVTEDAPKLLTQIQAILDTD